MNILYQKTLADGRIVTVYNDGTQQNNIIAVIKTKGNVRPKILRLKEEADRWKDELAKELGLSQEELELA